MQMLWFGWAEIELNQDNYGAHVIDANATYLLCCCCCCVTGVVAEAVVDVDVVVVMATLSAFGAAFELTGVGGNELTLQWNWPWINVSLSVYITSNFYYVFIQWMDFVFSICWVNFLETNLLDSIYLTNGRDKSDTILCPN